MLSDCIIKTVLLPQFLFLIMHSDLFMQA